MKSNAILIAFEPRFGPRDFTVVRSCTGTGTSYHTLAHTKVPTHAVCSKASTGATYEMPARTV